ncbi:MAG: RNA polymerase factor sigma-32 [Alphaproteobacteria bacterium]
MMSHSEDATSRRANSAYIRKTMKAPLLERDHEFDLARKWRDEGDEAALHELIEAYARLVVASAAKFRHYGLPMGDLIQEGNVGLMQAAARFEPEREVRFSTYANWWIRSSIQDFVLRNWSIVRTGTTAAQKSLFFNLRRLRAKINATNETEELGDAGREAIAEELGVKLTDVEQMEGRLSAGDQSLNAPMGMEEGDSASWLDMLADDTPTPDALVTDLHDSAARSELIQNAVNTLNEREQMIIRRRRLVDDEDSSTLEQLGNELGVSKERVRQLEARALGKIKTHLTKSMKDPKLFLTAG